MCSRVDLEPDPESAAHATWHDHEYYDRELDQELYDAGIGILQLFQHCDITQINIPKAAMKEATMKEPMSTDTNPTRYSLPSMNSLLSIISAVPGPAVFKRWSGTAGLPGLYAWIVSTIRFEYNTIINSCADILLKCLANVCLRQFAVAGFTTWREFDPVNISGRYPGSWRRGPAETVAPAFYHPSRPGTASMEICPTWLPAWHWSASPVALYCKARSLISCLLY